MIYGRTVTSQLSLSSVWLTAYLVQSRQEYQGVWTRRMARFGIELGAIGSIGHDLAVGTAETRARLIPFASPNDYILQNVPCC